MSAVHNTHRSSRWFRAIRRKMAAASDIGQTAIVAVVGFSVLAMLVGVFIVQTSSSSGPLLQAQAVQVYVHRALEAGETAYIKGINTNPSLAQCNSSTNGSGTCGGIDYGQWNSVNGSNASGADQEYYAFGNPQPTIDPTTHALDYLTIQIAGAAYDPTTTNHYLFQQETITISPKNGFLQNVWWSNYESYSSNGNYSKCSYNWATKPTSYNISNANLGCTPVYFGPTDYLFGPVYTNDSVFVSGDGSTKNSPSFGTSSSPSPVTTADPNCLFVDNDGRNDGMQGTHSSCSTNATGEVALYDSTNSSSGNPVETPPTDDDELGTVASYNGCLYSGPTQITLSTSSTGVGQMSVISPDTPDSLVSGSWVDSDNISTNSNSCPNDGTTVSLPSNGVVYVEDATAGQTQAWANPFDDPTYNTVTNVVASPAPVTSNSNGKLIATVTSGSNQINSGATVAFSQSTTGGNSVISACSAVALSNPVAVTPATNPPTYTSTATCSGVKKASNGTGTYTAASTSGNATIGSSGNTSQTNTLNSSESYGPDAQVSAARCSSCYYGQTSNPDAEGDAFVNGVLSGQLTIGTSNDVIVDGNITYNDCNWALGQSGSSAPQLGLCQYNLGGTNDSLGLIADNYAEINRPILASSSGSNPNVLPYCAGTPAATCDPSDGTDGVIVDAAVLALTQSFVVNNYTASGTEGPLVGYGSIQQYARGPVGTFNGNNVSTGYQKQYTWDPRLEYLSPPSYLEPSTATWVITSTLANQGAGSGSTNVCPPLQGVYPNPTNYITQYCATGTGALPNYPSVTAPSAPTITNPAATANLNGTVTLNWTDPASNNGSPITQYNVTTSPSCTTCSFSGLTSPTSTSTTITGLTALQTYNFSVSATNASGTSDPSALSNSVTVPGAPNAPSSVAASTNDNGSITVNWTDPNNNGSVITGYQVTPSPACSTCTYSSLTGASVSTATVTGLTKGGSYTFTVTATNAVGTSPASSASISVTVPNVPGAPTIGSATLGNASATVTWTAPSVNGGSAVTGYVVTPYIGSTAQTAQTFVSVATTESVINLTNGTAYTFKVAATNGVGTGAQSGASNSVTPATVPGAPTIGTATAGVASATVSWTAPSSNGFSAITGYVVTPYIGSTAQPSQEFDTTATTDTLTGLNNSTTYTFKVAAINVIGTGAQSASSASVATASDAGAPTIGTATAGVASAIVKWTAPSSTGGSPITGYVVTPYIGSTAQAAQTFNSIATTETVTGLNNGTAYTFKVAAINAIGTGAQSAASASITTFSVPGAPTIGTVTAGTKSATVRWTAPSSTGGSPITGYVVTPYIGSTAQAAQTFNSIATTEIATGLTTGTTYTFKVAAITLVGTGTQSAASASVRAT